MYAYRSGISVAVLYYIHTIHARILRVRVLNSSIVASQLLFITCVQCVTYNKDKNTIEIQ